MYREWARRRRMQLTTLDEQLGDGVKQPFRLVLAVSGFGSHSILSAEAGLHVLESPAADGRGFERSRAGVRVAPQQGDPDGGGPAALRRAAEAAFSQAPLGEPRIVRRYRREPSPLVRDGVRGWRTGRIDRVLDGNFDLMLDT